eukprot:GHVU01214913.1.p1 GENE.GHVU01214913.1~~GHVU01214913.1.p1  ORF type:complete len:136 (+),score=15.46 GHVU01214913.1:41-409(+)
MIAPTCSQLKELSISNFGNQQFPSSAIEGSFECLQKIEFYGKQCDLTFEKLSRSCSSTLKVLKLRQSVDFTCPDLLPDKYTSLEQVIIDMPSMNEDKLLQISDRFKVMGRYVRVGRATNQVL